MKTNTTEYDLISTNTLRLGFAGVGWIGKNRLDSVIQSENISKACICDTSAENISAVLSSYPQFEATQSFENLLSCNIDGVVIATPSALHAAQTIAALERGLAVFCQKPLGRNPQEVNEIIKTAERQNLLLGIDMSYRYCKAITALKNNLNAIGDIFAIETHFHNGYGPDKPWFYNPELSGGGCVIDLGIHLIDLIIYLMNPSTIKFMSSQLYSYGKRITKMSTPVIEDYATFSFTLPNECIVHGACSWNLPIGKDASIGLTLYGTQGGLSFRNVNGSFYDFTSEFFHKTQHETLSSPPDNWSGRAIVNWVNQLKYSKQFDRTILHANLTAEIIDKIYSYNL